MSVERYGRYTCDRCGVCTEVVFNGDAWPSKPKGWGSLGAGSGRDKDICRACSEDYATWWASPKAARVLATDADA